ncbi:histone-lysine N-methyltransferase SMYD3-like [Macrobrachium nipponense]|uniref:histone-lysine N-methyltransferase SMYD3-like n=1 Tax=Macrobrachium nipponense TaxID=159736 RepID=UPI0030C89001
MYRSGSYIRVVPMPRDYGHVMKARSFIKKKKQPVKRGDVIMSSRPFCWVVDSSLAGQYCEYCLGSFRKDRILTRCSDCYRAWYCSRMCRDLAEPLHRKECEIFRRKPEFKPRDTARFMARLICKLRDGGDEISEKVDDRRSRSFKDLMSHFREIKQDRRQLRYLREMMPDLKVLLGEGNLPDHSSLVTIYGKVMVNSFCLLDDHLTPIGTSIYLAASVFDHSCVANAFVSFIGNRLVIRSLVDWPDLDLNLVRISYIDSMNTRAYRQLYLKDHYFFLCDCRICKDDQYDRMMSTVACGNPNCENPVYINEKSSADLGPCSACGFSDWQEDLRQDYKCSAVLARNKLQDLDENHPDFEVWREVVDQQSDMFHPLNILRAKSLDALLTATINLRGWLTALGIARKNHSAIRHYYGPKHPTYGLFLLKLAKIESNNMEWDSALRHLQEAEEILESGLGSNHPLFYSEFSWLIIQASEESKVKIQRSIMYGGTLKASFVDRARS